MEDFTAKMQQITSLQGWIQDSLITLAFSIPDNAEAAVKDVLNNCPINFHPLQNHEIWHDVPYALLHCCMKHQIQNSSLVSQVLELSWVVLKDFSCIFSRPKRRLRTFELLHPFISVHDDARTQSYFLKHSYAQRQKIDGHRFVDILNDIHGTCPIFEAMYEHNVPTVQILLQHGCHLQLTGFLQEKSVFASKFQSKTERDKAYKQWFQEQSVRKLFSSLRLTFNKLRPRKRKQYDVDAFAEFHFNRLNLLPETDDIFKILNLLFRCIPKLGREILNYLICPQNVVHHKTDALTWPRVTPEGILSWGSRYWDFDHEYWHFLNGLCNNGFLPAFLERTSQPAKLKHLCRCSIRKRLNENWQLPFGIQRLDMPKSLQKYLNIEED